MISAGACLLAAAAALTAGGTTERVVCPSDPNESYALYLPPGYDTARKWPILFVMDPRGHALLALQLFKPGAERRGYIVASSYNTESDGPRDVNAAALTAILADVRQRLALDERRFYLAGFSGTARSGWEFARQLPGRVAGLLGFGAGLPPGMTANAAMRFAFFGGSGRLDFNYEEVRALDAPLSSLGIAHRFAWYDGPHSWCPEDVCTRALDWMELQAIKGGLRESDAAARQFVSEYFTREIERARGLETGGDLLSAWDEYARIAGDFDGLSDVAAAREKASQLEKQPEVRAGIRQARKNAEDQRAYESRFSTFLSGFRSQAPPPLEESLKRLQIDPLKKRAAAGENKEDALAAQRLLELVAVHCSFYVPRELLEMGDPGRALAILRISEAIEPDSPSVQFGIARARAQLGQTKEAVEILARLVDSGAVDAQLLANDRYLAPLKGNEGFEQILKRLAAPAAPN